MILRLSAFLALLLLLAATARSQSLYSPYPSRTTIIAQADQQRSNSSVVNHVRQHTSGRTVLGYVTPWHPRGIKMAEAFRGKFDILAPAWHTIEPLHLTGETYYQVGGGPTSEADKEWVKRLQAPGKDSEGNVLDPVNISPRYVLDKFTPEDLVELLNSKVHMASLASGIVDSVLEHQYNGIVFECAAVWAISPLVELLSDRLHDEGKTISVVLPGMRQGKATEDIKSNQIILHGLRTLSNLVDHVMIMTYDHAGSQGVAFGEAHALKELPPGSPLAREGVRTPGPNTPLDFLVTNIEQLSGDMEVSDAHFAIQQAQGWTHSFESKLLMGLPLYGYSYAVAWFDKSSNSSDGIPRIPPSSPIGSKDNDTEAQARSRGAADKKDREKPTVVPVLRFPGEPFKHSDLVAQLDTHKALIRLDEASQEQYFDYVKQLPPSQQPKLTDEDKAKLGDQDKPLASYYRAYFPSAYTMQQRLKAIGKFNDVGVALWDVGMAGEWLLHEL